ncbi:hypothetical protein BLJ_0338 [Bifidobacterium longum subsp. longum JDM301]|uniref:Uncharacterized protein n=1 Tax=Bifidobacterium longum subsp. longum (strain JDM301) TaxID=759350 RepID=D6ZY23_BIFLJ|nr:hypothetical protein BLJ_0338 [Bifidobacterium longum subsp. longum JDM301]
MCCFLLLLHNISPWISIFPKDKVSREQTDMTTVIGQKMLTEWVSVSIFTKTKLFSRAASGDGVG